MSASETETRVAKAGRAFVAAFDHATRVDGTDEDMQEAYRREREFVAALGTTPFPDSTPDQSRVAEDVKALRIAAGDLEGGWGTGRDTAGRICRVLDALETARAEIKDLRSALEVEQSLADARAAEAWEKDETIARLEDALAEEQAAHKVTGEALVDAQKRHKNRERHLREAIDPTTRRLEATERDLSRLRRSIWEIHESVRDRALKLADEEPLPPVLHLSTDKSWAPRELQLVCEMLARALSPEQGDEG